MERKVYSLMNWPEIEGIVYSECDNPHELLGGHMCKEGFLIQVFYPDAVEVSVKVDGKTKLYAMEKVDEAGYYAVIIPGRKKYKYSVIIEDIKGKKTEMMDPYSYECTLKADELRKIAAATSDEVYKILGAHIMNIGGIDGVRFAVWAPDALRVSVVGNFNNWDGRVNQMRCVADSGVFEIFIPSIGIGTEYMYEVKARGSIVNLKLDPYSAKTIFDERFSSVVSQIPSYNWSDSKWISERKVRDTKTGPMAICEISQMDFADKNIVDNIVKCGFNYVEVMPLCEYSGKNTSGYETINYFAPTYRVGDASGVMEKIDEFHKNGIGVILDWNCAFMSMASMGIYNFDGGHAYDAAQTKYNNHQELNVSTFDYSKPQVTSLLLSSMRMWCEHYHIDGFRVDEVASMLYLDYGKNPGEWKTNIYGNNENLDAIDFIKNMRRLLDKNFAGCLLIAEESSLWSQVTGDVTDGALGFDYRWNNGWNEDFVSFLKHDPLFRKGVYNKLTDSMLYNYTDDFILDMSHETLEEVGGTLCNIMPEISDKAITAETRAAYGYMYAYPGKKLVSYSEMKYFKEYIEKLNKMYFMNAALYEQDYADAGFEWVNDSAVEETVVAFDRIGSDGETVMTVVNFTPVLRQFSMNVSKAGKYIEIFNSDSTDFGGDGNVNKAAVNSVESDYDDGVNMLTITLPASGMCSFVYEPYTEIEKEEIRILREARVAKLKADEEAKKAEELRQRAEMEAARAVKAQQEAEARAKEALEAKENAQKQAKEAEKLSRKIDQATKAKLTRLKNKENKEKK